MILSRVSPVTHSIGNCVKRVVVIVASVLVFQNPVTRLNAMGEFWGDLSSILSWVCGCVALSKAVGAWARGQGAKLCDKGPQQAEEGSCLDS